MEDDIFSRMQELFSSTGDVNFKLGAELARHLAGESQAVDPWAAEEFRELARLAEFRVDQAAPFPVHPAPDILPVDARGWADRNLEGFRSIIEPYGSMIDLSAAGPAGEMLRPLGPAMAGMQAGTLVGSLATWVMASFDAGIPVDGAGPIAVIIPAVESFVAQHGFDAKDVRLWVAANETAHRALFQVPFAKDHLVRLARDHADSMRIPPERLMEMMSGFDPSNLQSGFDAESLASLFDSPATAAAARELTGFLGLCAGYRRILVERSVGELLPTLGRIDAARDADRTLGEAMQGSPFSATFVDVESIETGKAFCLDVEERFGPEALARMFTLEGRFPTAEELQDPVGYAARVMLEDW